jgi:hypothetical protein
MSYSTGTRASDLDRNSVIDVLANAFSDGQITQIEYDERSAAALRAPTLAELRSLTRDLQTQPTLVGEPTTPALPPTHTMDGGSVVGNVAAARLASWFLRLLTIGIVIGLFLFGLQLFSDDTESSESPDTSGADSGDRGGVIPPLVIPGPPDMLTADGLDTLVESARREIGSTMVSSLYLQRGYASFETRRNDMPGSYSYSYYYDGFLGEPTYSETAGADDPLVDLADIDSSAMQELMDGMPSRLGIGAPTNSYITLSFDAKGKSPRLMYYLSGAQGSGYAIATFAGDVLDVYKP